MITMAVGLLALGQGETAKAILAEACAKLRRADALSMAVERTTEELPRPWRTECAYRRNGFLREDDGRTTRVANPKAAWSYSSVGKTYRAFPVPSNELATTPWMRWFDVFVAEFPILEGPASVAWHGLRALRIELDGRMKMTKETKLFVYLDPKTHLPLGVSANLGSITQVVIFRRMKLAPNLDEALFSFVPPKAWKRQNPNP